MKKIDNSKKIILDLCGGTGAWSKPYKDAGYDVRVITLPDYDVRTYEPPSNVYGILVAPPCTEFSKTNWRISRSARNFKEGMKCVRACLDIIWVIQENGAPLEFWALENPLGYLYNFLGKPAFYFQPWQFGETSCLATKRICLWGYFNLPTKTVLKRTIPFVSPHSSKRDKIDKEKNNKGWNKLNAAERAITPPGFAKAFFNSNK